MDGGNDHMGITHIAVVLVRVVSPPSPQNNGPHSRYSNVFSPVPWPPLL